MTTYFDSLIGNEPAKLYLDKMIRKNVVGNSLLFAGPDGVGKSLFAIAFTKAILKAEGCSDALIRKIDHGNHPDIHVYRPEGKIGMHSIESMRSFTKEVYMEPFEASRKFFIIHDADRMLPASANALLKTFEEPSLDSIIILISGSPESLLTTIKSRCRTFHFHAVSTDDIEQLLINHYQVASESAKQCANLAHGSVSNAIRLATQGADELRQMVLNMLAQGFFPTYKDLTEAIKTVSSHVEESRTHVEERLRKEISHGHEQDMTAIQRHALDKEVAGSARMKLGEEAHEIFEAILSWYRDLEILSVNGNQQHLRNPDYLEAMQNTLQKGSLLSLEKAQKAVRESCLALERSTSLQICMETLFLKLRLC